MSFVVLVFIRHVGDSLYTLRLTSKDLLLVLTQVLETKISFLKAFVYEFEVNSNRRTGQMLTSWEADIRVFQNYQKIYLQKFKHFRLTYYTAISSWSSCVPRMPYRFRRWYNKVEKAHPAWEMAREYDEFSHSGSSHKFHLLYTFQAMHR